jgi:hypothetical protein
MRLPRRGSAAEEGPLSAEFKRRQPWVTRFTIDGVPYGGELSYDGDARIDHFWRAFPDARAILELGSLEGGQTFRLAERPGVEVTAVEVRPENVEKARFVQRELGIDNVTFVVGNLEQTEPAAFGSFDAIFCSGLLYHLPEPWKLLDGLRGAAPNALIWTHYADHAEEEVAGLPGYWYVENDLSHPLSGVSPRSFFIERDAIVERLRRAGFARVDLVDDEPDHEPFPCVTLLAADG